MESSMKPSAIVLRLLPILGPMIGIVAGLGAEGETIVADAHHIDRGYDRFVEKLRAIGADVKRD